MEKNMTKTREARLRNNIRTPVLKKKVERLISKYYNSYQGLGVSIVTVSFVKKQRFYGGNLY